MTETNTMYSQNVYFPDAFKGCKNDCVYCKPSFQRQAKRQKQNCGKCYTFEPHIHKERILKDLHQTIGKSKVYAYRTSPKTEGDEFVFFPKGGDLAFANAEELKVLLDFIDNNPQTRFLIQTKCPGFMLDRHNQEFMADNVIFGITLESDREQYDTPSLYTHYSEISKATPLGERVHIFSRVPFKHKYVTIEPILQFRLDILVSWLRSIKPEVIYIGYDTKGCNLPEPTLAETQALIEQLKGFGFTVRLKTIRKAWYETQPCLICPPKAECVKCSVMLGEPATNESHKSGS